MPKHKNRGEKRHKRRLKVKARVKAGLRAEHEENGLTRTGIERSAKGIVGRPTASQRDEALYRAMTRH